MKRPIIIGVVLCLFSSPVWATTIQNVPGLIQVTANFYLSPSSNLSTGLDQSDLATSPDSPLELHTPTWDMMGYLSGSDGSPFTGDEYFVLSLPSKRDGAYYLDSVTLYLSGSPNYHEFPSEVLTDSLTYAAGYGYSDLISALDPGGGVNPHIDGNYIGIESGYLILGFPSSVPVPEPSTLFLLGSGLAGVIAWRRKNGKKDQH